MASLLVSVRSAAEARAAVAGGAAIIDVKEPARGPLGRADTHVWSEVRSVVPESIPVSAALGELREWTGPPGTTEESSAISMSADRPERSLAAAAFAGVAFRKLGLAGAGRGWERDWERVRGNLGPGPRWVAVAYADWRRANAPHPDEVLAAALACRECCGLLVDTWDKARPGLIDGSWAEWIARARRGGLVTVVAGSLDETSIVALAALAPDYFGVRGAACGGGNRLGAIDPARVAGLVRAASVLPQKPVFLKRARD